MTLKTRNLQKKSKYLPIEIYMECNFYSDLIHVFKIYFDNWIFPEFLNKVHITLSKSK